MQKYHIHLDDYENDNNCYLDCFLYKYYYSKYYSYYPYYYYYFDSNGKHHCTEIDKCPENNKLILEKQKCIDNCTLDKDYKYDLIIIAILLVPAIQIFQMIITIYVKKV